MSPKQGFYQRRGKINSIKKFNNENDSQNISITNLKSSTSSQTKSGES